MAGNHTSWENRKKFAELLKIYGTTKEFSINDVRHLGHDSRTLIAYLMRKFIVKTGKKVKSTDTKNHEGVCVYRITDYGRVYAERYIMDPESDCWKTEGIKLSEKPPLPKPRPQKRMSPYIVSEWGATCSSKCLNEDTESDMQLTP